MVDVQRQISKNRSPGISNISQIMTGPEEEVEEEQKESHQPNEPKRTDPPHWDRVESEECYRQWNGMKPLGVVSFSSA